MPLRPATTLWPPVLLGSQFVFNIGFYAVVPFLAIFLRDDMLLSGGLIGLILGLRTFSQQGMFIVGGKKASIRLPSGYYRITCMVGDAWYGLDYLFGTESKTYNGSNAVQSRSGYINTVSFG